MTEAQSPLAGLALRLEQRRLRVLALRRAVYGAVAGLAAALPVALAGQLGIPLPAATMPLLVVVTPLLFTLSVPLGRRAPDKVLAEVDRREGLKERLVTAYEVSTSGSSSRFAKLAVDDAVERLSLLPPQWVYPRRIPLAAWAVPPLAGIVTVLLTVSLGLPRIAPSNGSLASAGSVLEESAQRLAARAESEPLPDSRQLALEMERLGRALRSGNPPPDSAAQLGVLSTQLDRQVRGLQRQLLDDLAQREQAAENGSTGGGGAGGRSGAGGPRSAAGGAGGAGGLSQTLGQMLQNQLSPDELNRLRQTLSNDSNLSSADRNRVARDFERNQAPGGGYDQSNLANDLLKSFAPDGATKQALSDLQSAQNGVNQAQRSLNDQQGAQNGTEQSGANSETPGGSSSRQLSGSDQAPSGESSQNGNGPGGQRGNRFDRNLGGGNQAGARPGGSPSDNAPDQGNGPSNLPGTAPDTNPDRTAHSIPTPSEGVPLQLSGSDSGGASIESLIRDLPAARENEPDVAAAARSYEHQMEAVIGNDGVPPTERKFVRDYFTSIQGEH